MPDPGYDDTNMTDGEFDREFAAGTPAEVETDRPASVRWITTVVSMTSNTGEGEPSVLPLMTAVPLVEVVDAGRLSAAV